MRGRLRRKHQRRTFNRVALEPIYICLHCFRYQHAESCILHPGRKS